MEYITGDLIKLANEGKFDVIAHGCNCFCTMGAGIAPQMAEAFNADNYPLEANKYKGSINKLGMIDYRTIDIEYSNTELVVVNAYTQYGLGANHKSGSKTPLDNDALRLCLRKMNKLFKGKHIGLPKIGCGLAGGNWTEVSKYIEEELTDCQVTIVNYEFVEQKIA